MAKAEAVQDNVVELRKNGPAEDAVVALNLGKIQRAKTEAETANGKYRNVLKHVEAKGIHLAAAKDAISIRKSGKVEEKVEYLKALTEYLLILGVPISKQQLDLFRVDGNDRDSIAKAQDLGRYCGIMGLGMDQNPYAPDSDAGQAWIKAWHGGCEERDMVISMEPDGDELVKGDTDMPEDEDE